MLELFTKLLFFYLPFQIALNPTDGVDLASVRIFIPLLFILWLIDSLKNKKLLISSNLIFILFISFLFICSFSLFFADNLIWGIKKLLFLFSIFPLFFVIYDRFSDNKVQILSLLKYTVWGALVASSVGVIQFLLQFIVPLDKLYLFWSVLVVPFLGNSFSEAVLENPSWLVNVGGHTLLRATAFFPDPHMFSFYLNICALLSLGMFFSHNKNQTPSSGPTPFWGLDRYTYLIFFFILILTSFLTFSRGGYLGLITGLTFFTFYFLKSKLSYSFKNTKKVFIFSTLVIIVLLFFIIPNHFSSRLISSFSLSEGSNNERFLNWQQSFTLIKENPLLGVGLGNYALHIKPSATYREPFYSHNTLLDISAETGMFNAFLWISMFLFAILNFLKKFSIKNNYLYLGLASALVSFFIHSLFETPIFSVHILPLIILILALAKSKENE